MDDYRKIAINGYVTIKNGDAVIVEKGRNAIVRAGMRHFLSLMSYSRSYMTYTGTSYNNTQWRYWNFGSISPYIRFGKDNSPTTQLMDGLVSQIAVNQTSLTNSYGASDLGNGRVMTKWVANWASGVLNAQLGEDQTLGEVGIWLNLEDKFAIGDNITPDLYISTKGSVTYVSPSQMFARFSLGDAAFVPDSAKPVLVEWEFGWEFV